MVSSLFIKNMIPILETPRLILRPFEWSDIDAVGEFLKDKSIVENSPILKKFYSDADGAESFINDHRPIPSVYAISLKNPLITIGGIGLDIDTGHFCFFIGKQYRRNGYATEAVKRIINHAFSNFALEEVKAEILKSNTDSQKFIETIPLKFTGNLIDCHISGKIGAFKEYAVNKGDFYDSNTTIT